MRSPNELRNPAATPERAHCFLLVWFEKIWGILITDILLAGGQSNHSKEGADGLMTLAPIKSLPEMLLSRADRQRSRVACTFLSEAEERPFLTFGELDVAARVLAANFRAEAGGGRRAILVFPPGLDFVRALWGCFYSGTVAVPVAWRRNRSGVDNLRRIAMDCDARMVITTSAVRRSLTALLKDSPELRGLTWIAVDEIDVSSASAWKPAGENGDSLALLQYTSGSTGTPRGVMLTHQNVISNLNLLQAFFGQDQSSIAVSWLPLFHDMGLIGSLLHSTFAGMHIVLMAPQTFLQNPTRWLRAISDYRATWSGGPNFAYELCANKIGARDKAGLDLSHWRVAFNGAEPVRRSTMEKFLSAFATCGFRADSFYPCYGLAEATLFVRGTRFKSEPLAEITPEEFSRTSGLRLGTGPAEVVIADPDSCTRCKAGTVGEIWVRGPSVGNGYWGQPQLSREIFHAHLDGELSDEYLRTGDLGVLDDGHLVVTGRHKAVIILHGANYQAEAIERTVLDVERPVSPLKAAAFAADLDEEERLVVVCEVPRRIAETERDALIAEICLAVTEAHGVEVSVLVFTRQGGIPTTSSGKVQRELCKNAWLENRLPVVHEATTTREHPAKSPQIPSPSSPQKNHIQSWLIDRVKGELPHLAQRINVSMPLASLGISSLRAVVLTGALGEWLGRALPATLFYDFPTIEQAAAHLAGEQPQMAPVAPVSQRALPVAAVGCACRFPGANSPEEFWQLIQEGRECIFDVPTERWDSESLFDLNPESRGKIYTRRGGFIDNIDRFDNEFFGISMTEARAMDPQQRLLLELTVEALERAGQPLDALAGTRTGVFIGICGNDYASRHLRSGDPARVDAYSITGSSPSVAAGRIAYTLGLHGPALSVDTACSSSLTAIHLGCQSLAAGECDLAIAGGVNLTLTPDASVSLSRMHALSPSGHSRVFDADADGYVRSEGCGVVILKREDSAIASCDRILGVIASTAINQDGRSNGLTAPSRPAQEALLREALERAGADPVEIKYVEAHGTGTPLGDPIEVSALASVLCKERPIDDPLRLGSVKANIGHLEASAGIAALIKGLLIIEHGVIPPQIQFSKPNPHIPWDRIAIRVPVERELIADRKHLLIGVSSFGFSGSNAHAILRAGNHSPRHPEEVDKLQIFTLSAKTPTALTRLASHFVSWLERNPDAGLADICYSVNSGRAAWAERLALLAGNTRELLRLLKDWVAGERQPAQCDASLESAGRLDTLEELRDSFVRGLPIDWRSFYRERVRPKLILPTSSFESKRIWMEPNPTQGLLSPITQLPGERRYSPLHDAIVFEMNLVGGNSVFDEHKIGGAIVVPAAGHIALVLEGVRRAFGFSNYVLENLVFPQPLILTEHVAQPIQLVFWPQATKQAKFEVFSRDAHDNWTKHAFGLLKPSPAQPNALQRKPEVDESSHPASAGDFADAMRRLGFQLGPSFLWNEAIWQRGTEVDARMRVPEPDDLGLWRTLHPGQIDSMFQLVRAFFPLHLNLDDVFVPLSIERFKYSGLPVKGAARAYARLREQGNDPGNQETIAADLRLTDEAGVGVAIVRGLVLKRAPNRALVPREHAGTDARLYQIEWREKTQRSSCRENFGRCLIASGSSELAVALARELEARGASCGVECSERRRADWRSVLSDNPFDKVLYVPAVGDDPVAAATTVCQSALALAQAILETQPVARLSFVTQGLSASEPGLHQLPHWPLWGLGNTIALEHPQIWGGIFDHDGDIPALAEEIISFDEDIVALRGGTRLTPHLEGLDDSQSSPWQIRADATYLITGGLGNLGRKMAAQLASDGARHLILAGRKATTNTHMNGPEMNALRRAGVDLAPVDCDVTSPRDMAQLGGLLATTHPAVRGVIHAAGVFGDRSMAAESGEHISAVMAPKVGGSWLLHQATDGLALDFFICMASMAGLSGSEGQCAYAAANAFMDGLARFRRSRGLCAVSIDWAPWLNSPVLASLSEAQRRRLSRRLELLEPEYAAAMLTRRTNGPAQVAIFSAGVDFPRHRPFLSSVVSTPTSSASFVRPLDIEALRSGSEIERLREIRRYVNRLVVSVLGEESERNIPPQLPFQELGMDSMIALEMVQALNSDIGETLPPTLPFNYPTLETLAQYLNQLLFPGPGREQELESTAEAEVRQLSEQELEDLVNEEFAQITSQGEMGGGATG